MNKLSKALLRSLLRWNRQEAVRKVPFTLVPSELGCEQVLPKEAVICGSAGVEKAIRWAFRNTPYSNENIDAGFAALKSLNAYSLKLKDMVMDNQIHGNEMFFRHATFRVGQVVEHKETHVRGVVVGWEVDVALQKQSIQVLVDLTDQSELGARAGGFKKLRAGSEFVLVHDRSLHRIQNSEIWALFSEYDEAAGRYAPSVELLYRYPRDCDDTLISSPWYSLEGQEALRAVKGELHQLAQELLRLQEEHFPCLSRPTEALSEQEHIEQSVVQQVLDEFFAQVRSLSRLVDPQDKTGEEVTEEVLQWRRKEFPAHVYGDARKSFQAVNVLYEAAHTAQSLVSSLDQILSLRFQTSPTPFDLLPTPQPEVRQAFPHLAALDAAAAPAPSAAPLAPARYAVGQVVRHSVYQYRGVICGYDLIPTTNTSSWYPDTKNTNKNTDNSTGNTTEKDKDTRDTRHDLDRPHHSQPYYKVIPDEGDVARLLGQHRVRGWYYIAEDHLAAVTDPSELVVTHYNLYRYFLGWDTVTARFRAPHAMAYCFPCAHHAFPPTYPADTPRRRWRDTHAYMAGAGAEAESDTIASLNHTTGCEATDAEELLRVQLVDSELGIYARIDRFLLAVYHTVKQRHGAARQAYARQPDEPHTYVRHLLRMLRNAPTGPMATGAENLLWHVMMAHSAPAVNATMRRGFMALRAGNFAEATEHFGQAVAQDATYGEAYNKLAAAQYAQRDYAQCFANDSKAAQLFRGHYGALAGLGLSVEQMAKDPATAADTPGTTTEAVYREALTYHPWAHSLCTALQLLSVKQQHEAAAKAATATATEEEEQKETETATDPDAPESDNSDTGSSPSSV